MPREAAERKRGKGEKGISLRSSNSPLLLFPSAPLQFAIAVFVLFLAAFIPATAEQRFPPPDFTETNHQIPITTTPAARAEWLQYLDVSALFACLGAALWLIYKQRSRRGLFWLSIFSLAYFGFWRKGCICAIG